MPVSTTKLGAPDNRSIQIMYISVPRPIALSLQDLSIKLAMLLALTSAARVHELIALDKVNVAVKMESLRFLSICEEFRAKPSREGNSLLSLNGRPQNVSYSVQKNTSDKRVTLDKMNNNLFHTKHRTRQLAARHFPDEIIGKV